MGADKRRRQKLDTLDSSQRVLSEELAQERVSTVYAFEIARRGKGGSIKSH